MKVGTLLFSLLLWVPLWTPLVGIASSCPELLHAVPIPGPVSKSTLAARLEIYWTHQNQLRSEAGLEPIPMKSLQKAIKKYSESPRSEYSRSGVVEYGHRLTYEGDWIIPIPKTDDAHGLNYVYQFKEGELVQAIPALQYFIERYPSDSVTLVRVLSREEYRLWQARDLEGLRKGAERRSQWGYSQSRLHFALDLAWRDSLLTVSVSVPKSVLLEWGKKGWATIGREGRSTEIVLLEPVWDELMKYVKP